MYDGKVVNITKFGAFVNVLPGRDGLLHISKLSSLAGGKRINNVEDVLTLGQPVEVRVDDIDPQGKVSLSLASAPEAPAAAATGGRGDGDGGGGAVAVRRRQRRRRLRRRPRLTAVVGALLRGRLRGRAGGRPRRPRARVRPTADGGRGDDRGRRPRSRPAAGPLPSSLIETSVLPCGIRLVTETMADVRSVAVAYWVGTGSRDEPGELAGAVALPRAPPLQGDGAALGRGHRRGARRGGR